MVNSLASPFARAAVAAFPQSCGPEAESAALAIAPFADHAYRITTINVTVAGAAVQIPTRLHFLSPYKTSPLLQGDASAMAQCLCTRSTDGYIRQAYLRSVVKIDEPWAIPFVVLLAGDYVIEIAKDLKAALSSLNRDAYIGFVRENRPLLQLLSQRATSYWNCYHSSAYPERSAYPGVNFLRELEIWAS
jgi:hypothetical protein